MSKFKLTQKNRLSIYKILILIFFLSLFIVPDGLQAIPEIDLRILATAIGIDKDETGTIISAQIIIPAEQSNATTKEISTARGKSISDALETMSIKLGRRIELGHCGVIALGNEFSKQGVTNELSNLISGAKISPNVNIVTTSQTAEEFLFNANKLDDNASLGLNNYITFANKGVHASTVSLLNFLSNTNSLSKTCVIPLLEAKEEKKPKEKAAQGGTENQQQSAGNTSEENKKKKGLDSLETSVILVDGKKSGELDKEETYGFVWLDDKSTKGLIPSNPIELNGEVVDDIYGYLKNKKLKIKATFENGKPKAIVNIKTFLQIEERKKYGDNGMLNDEESLKVIQLIKNGFKDNILSSINKTIEKSRAINADIFCFNNLFNKYRYNEYNKFIKENPDNFLSELTIDCNINVILV